MPYVTDRLVPETLPSGYDQYRRIGAVNSRPEEVVVNAGKVRTFKVEEDSE
jgi:hypothetical protein